MFKRLVMVCLLALTGAPGAMAGDELFLHIDMLTTEQSKDSNSQHYIVAVKNNEVGYQYRYRGFPGNADESITRTLSDDELSNIVRYIRENMLDKAITESKACDNGPSREVRLSLVLTLDGETIESNISGDIKIFHGDEVMADNTVDNKEYVKNISRLIAQLKGLKH